VTRKLGIAPWATRSKAECTTHETAISPLMVNLGKETKLIVLKRSNAGFNLLIFLSELLALLSPGLLAEPSFVRSCLPKLTTIQRA